MYMRDRATRSIETFIAPRLMCVGGWRTRNKALTTSVIRSGANVVYSASVQSRFTILNQTLRDMVLWKNGCWTECKGNYSKGLFRPSDFWHNIRRAISCTVIHLVYYFLEKKNIFLIVKLFISLANICI